MPRTSVPGQLKYLNIKRELDSLVTRLSAGDRLPSERALARSFDCTAMTVRKAMMMLVEEGAVIRQTGSGTFVAETASPGADRAMNSRSVSPRRLGMLVLAESDGYALRLLQALGRAGETEDVELRSDWVQDFGKRAVRRATALADEGCAAIVIPWFPAERAEEVAEFVRRSPLPTSLPLLLPGLERNCFEKPDVFGQATIRAVEGACSYFRLIGQERIAYFGPDRPSDQVLQRGLSAYTSFACREGMELMCGLVDERAVSVDGVVGRWKQFKGALAILCYDDAHALRIMTAMHKANLRAPRDYRIQGFNDTEEARSSDPPLTSMCQSYDYSARALIANALALSRGRLDQAEGGQGFILMLRQSCGGRDALGPEQLRELERLGITVRPDGPSENARSAEARKHSTA